MPVLDQPVVGVSGITVATSDVDSTREAWSRFAGAPEADSLVVGGLVVGVSPARGGPEGLTGVTLSVENVSAFARLLQRRGLRLDGTTLELGGLTWRLAGTTGVHRRRGHDAGDIDGIDHVVVESSDPERAVALYGARLGLDLRLDRTMPRHRMRGLFFRCGQAVLEVITRLDDEGTVRGAPGVPDAFGGLAWRVPDVGVVRDRLMGDGVDVSEVREGRRPGTQVATVHDPELVVPTLLIGAPADGSED